MCLGPFLSCYDFRVALNTVREISYSTGCPVRRWCLQSRNAFLACWENGWAISVYKCFLEVSNNLHFLTQHVPDDVTS